jgi:hypothetical protein
MPEGAGVLSGISWSSFHIHGAVLAIISAGLLWYRS